MTNGLDLTTFIPKFIDENRDRIQKLNQTILALEKNPSNPELLKEILREIHTLKGTAKIMGFSDIVTLSHKVEDLFVKIRDGALLSSKELYDTVFKALDALANLVEIKQKNTQSTVNREEIYNHIETFLHNSKTQGTEAEVTRSGVDKILSDTVKPPVATAEASPLALLPVEGRKTTRVDLDKIDALYNHLVELIIAQMTFHQRCEEIVRLSHYTKQLRTARTKTHATTNALESDTKSSHETFIQYQIMEESLLKEITRFSNSYETDVAKLDTIIEGIRHQVMFMRMQPISTIFDLTTRLVRDLSGQFQKDVDLVISGTEVELDNTIIDMLKDPLVHLLRNAVDHGIEEPAIRESRGKKRMGIIALRAEQEGGDIIITVEDDGKGIDKELIKETAVRKGLLRTEKVHELSDEEIYGFIIKPGFSTSRIITDTSGRGIGMDIVKTVVDRLNGSLIIESNKGSGSRFILKVPATIALVNVLIAQVGTMTFAIPSTSIEQIAYIFWRDVKTLDGRASVFLEDQTIPLVDLVNIFQLEKDEDEKKDEGVGVPVIISHSEGKKVGFIVSEFLSEREVVFQEFKGYLKRPPYFSGITTLGTGEVILILNMQELMKTKDTAHTVLKSEDPKAGKHRPKKNTILIVEDSIITAELEKNILENAGYDVDIATDGIDALDKLPIKKYDLLVTDVDMPRMNGFELTAKIRSGKRLKDIPIIIVTAREKAEDKRRGIEVGADAYILKKEFDQSNLLSTIKRLIGE
jgi:chemotaxis protein histidine kinase CheA